MVKAIAGVITGAVAYELFGSYINDFIEIVVAIFNIIPNPFKGILLAFITAFTTIIVAKLVGVLK